MLWLKLIPPLARAACRNFLIVRFRVYTSMFLWTGPNFAFVSGEKHLVFLPTIAVCFFVLQNVLLSIVHETRHGVMVGRCQKSWRGLRAAIGWSAADVRGSADHFGKVHDIRWAVWWAVVAIICIDIWKCSVIWKMWLVNRNLWFVSRCILGWNVTSQNFLRQSIFVVVVVCSET